jgi:hypothetical protein
VQGLSSCAPATPATTTSPPPIRPWALSILVSLLNFPLRLTALFRKRRLTALFQKRPYAAYKADTLSAACLASVQLRVGTFGPYPSTAPHDPDTSDCAHQPFDALPYPVIHILRAALLVRVRRPAPVTSRGTPVLLVGVERPRRRKAQFWLRWSASPAPPSLATSLPRAISLSLVNVAAAVAAAARRAGRSRRARP